MQGVALQVRVILLLLDALGDRLLVTEGKVTGNRFPLLLGLGALQDDLLLHGCEKVKLRSKPAAEGGATPN